MTISTTTVPQRYSGNGSTKIFSYPYHFYQGADLIVSLVSTVSGAATLQTIDVDYTVTGAGDPGGGTLTFGTAPTLTQVVNIVRNPVATQDTNLTANGGYNPLVHEDALDRIYQMLQFANWQASRSLRLPDTAADATLTIPFSRASKLLGFDGSGNLTTYTQSEGGAGVEGLDDLADVDAASPSDTFSLVWDANTSNWVAAERPLVAFKTISVSGQDNIVADTATDTLTLVAGDGILITTSAGSDAITITNTGGGGGGGDGSLDNVVEDATPQLGGQLDVNGFALGDGSLELLKFTEVASAVNELTIRNAATGNAPALMASGDNTNVGINLIPKGSGTLQMNGNLVYSAGGTDVPLADGGTGASLTDPGADRIMFWDESSNVVTWLTVSTGLAITTTSIALSHLGLQSLTDPGGDRIMFWDDSDGALKWLALGTNLSITGTTLDATGSGGMSNLSDDTTPDLGGDLNMNNHNILWDAGRGIYDSSGNETVLFQQVGSAVNYFDLVNSATTFGPRLSAKGDDTNIDINFDPKGSGYTRSSGSRILLESFLGGSLLRYPLSGNLLRYVRADGSDDNDGSANDSAHAWLTLQYAWENICNKYDCRGYSVTIWVNDGTYFGVDSAEFPMNAASVFIAGLSGDATDVLIDSNSNYCFRFVGNGEGPRIWNVTCALEAISTGVMADEGATVRLNNVHFSSDDTAGVNIYANQGGRVYVTGDYTITGDCQFHIYAAGNAFVADSSGGTVTLSGTPAWAAGYAAAIDNSTVLIANTYSGSATGSRYLAGFNGSLRTGGGATYLPGNAVGVTESGGRYNAVSEVRAYQDSAGVASTNTLTSTSDLTANSSGVGTIKFKGSTSRDSSGFVKIYIGTVAYYVPCFSAISG